MAEILGSGLLHMALMGDDNLMSQRRGTCEIWNFTC